MHCGKTAAHGSRKDAGLATRAAAQHFADLRFLPIPARFSIFLM